MITSAIGYVRVSTEEQAVSGLGMDAQRAAIEQAAADRGWVLVGIEEDAGFSGKTTDGRPGLAAAIHAVESKRADVLIVSKLDRLTRSLADFAALMEQARRKRWQFVACDLAVDTTTPAGELVANVMASVANWERRVIGQRTRDALAAKKAGGARLGRPRVLAEEIRSRIVSERHAGTTWQRIADRLNDECVPTARGGKSWQPATVSAAFRSAQLDQCA
jgi:DNA invertase Pin-like site-specific DNA recombinase